VRLFGSESNNYSATLKVTDSNAVCLKTKTGKLTSELMQNEGGEYHLFDIVFKPPFVLQAGKKYFLASMVGHPSWYGQGGSFQVNHPSRVTFTLIFKHGRSSRIQKHNWAIFLI